MTGILREQWCLADSDDSLLIGDLADACACEPSYVEALTWLALGVERREDQYLLCHVGEEGGLGPFVMLYRLSGGSISVRSPHEALAGAGGADLQPCHLALNSLRLVAPHEGKVAGAQP